MLTWASAHTSSRAAAHRFRESRAAGQGEIIMSSNQEKPLSEVVLERRATRDFEPAPVPDEDLKKILSAGLMAPSANNLQPWRFVVVRDPEQRKRLRAAAMNQPKVEAAPVMIVACGDPSGWKSGDLEQMIADGHAHGTIDDKAAEGIRKSVSGYLGSQPGDGGGNAPDWGIWAARQTMIAFTTMMWTAETLGYDTAPMEGFFESKVKETLGIPESVRVVALLAIGRKRGEDRPFGGRFSLDRAVFDNSWGKGIKL